ncbi:MAG: HAMP domain-containing sensor histidine kinase [Legionellales bacterium]
MQNKDRSELEHVWGVIAHDLASPLQIIESNLNHVDKQLLPILLDGYKKAKAAGLDVSFIAPAQLERSQEILSSTKSVVENIRQNVSRWSHQLLSNKLSASVHPVEILKCIKESIINYRSNYSLEDKSRIRFDVHDEATVLGNEELIQYVVFELLDNADYAIEAMNNEEKTLVSITSSKDNNNYIVKIKNKCVPINSSDVEKFFDPYFSNKTSHVGLGLTFCKQAMQHMQGKIACHVAADGKIIELELTFQMANT